jgi:hypothetical protein
MKKGGIDGYIYSAGEGVRVEDNWLAGKGGPRDPQRRPWRQPSQVVARFQHEGGEEPAIPAPHGRDRNHQGALARGNDELGPHDNICRKSVCGKGGLGARDKKWAEQRFRPSLAFVFLFFFLFVLFYSISNSNSISNSCLNF